MQVVAGIVEDLADTIAIPLGDQVHPQSSVRRTDVLEDEAAIGARSGAEVLEHLVQPIHPPFTLEHTLKSDGSRQHGLSASRRSPHMLFLSALLSHG